MDCREAAGLLPDYLQQALTEAEARMLEEHLKVCPSCREEVDLWHGLESIRSTEPSRTLRTRFDEMLRAYREGVDAQGERRRWFDAALASRWIQVAAAVAVVGVAFTSGMFMERARSVDAELAAMRLELASTRQMVAISLLQNQSASDRLEGISWSTRLPQPNARLLDALLDRLRFDESVDLRLAALEALARYGNEPAVRGAVRRSLTHQRSPLVQIAVVDFLVHCRDRDALDELRALARGTDLLPEVREKVEWGINQLKRG